MTKNQISKRGSKSSEGYFYSTTMNDAVPFRGLPSFEWLYIADYTKEITSIRAWPIEVPYKFQGKEKIFIPSFEIKEFDQVIFVSCMYEKQLSSKQNLCAFAAMEAQCHQNKTDFWKITYEELWEGRTLSNIKILRQYAQHNVSADLKLRISTIVHATPNIAISSVIDLIDTNDPVNTTIAIMHMLYYHELETDISLYPISRRNLLYLESDLTIEDDFKERL